MTHRKDGVQPITYIVHEGGALREVESVVIEEAQVCIFVNGQELASFMCTPNRLNELAIGFLRSEGLIERLADIDLLQIADSNRCVDIWLKDLSAKLPQRRIITSGCGGGVTFDDLRRHHPPLTSQVTLTPVQVTALMKQLYLVSDLYQEARGVHTSVLSDGHEVLLVAQDVGRHNTIDRLWGQALLQNVSTAERILVASGRISSEMLGKAAKMGVPIVISRTSPTSLSTELARAWNITVIGYARGSSFRIYSAPERIVSGERTATGPA